jgi:hypothetical protein
LCSAGDRRFCDTVGIVDRRRRRALIDRFCIWEAASVIADNGSWDKWNNVRGRRGSGFVVDLVIDNRRHL